jgi:hypothetical protein
LRDEVIAVLKAREPARIMIAVGDRAANRWHLQFAERWVVQFNFYVNDEQWDRMFVRYAPLTAGLLSPIKADAGLHSQRRSQLDRVYQRVVDELDKLILAVGLKAA